MSRKRVKTAIIGVGRWGKNVARELKKLTDVVAYSTKDSTSSELSDTALLTPDDIAHHTDIEAVWVATPIDTHAALVRLLLESGKHVACEKPIAESAAEAAELAELAAQKNLALMTGYIFIYHPIYHELKRLVKRENVSQVECIWNKNGTFGESIEMNLLTHHLAIAYDLLGMPESGAYVSREAGQTACDKLDTVLRYPGATFTSRINRMSEEKAHRVIVTTTDGSTYEWSGGLLQKGDITIFESSEQPLVREIEAFLTDISGTAPAPTRGTFGAEVLRIHELIK